MLIPSGALLPHKAPPWPGGTGCGLVPERARVRSHEQDASFLCPFSTKYTLYFTGYVFETGTCMQFNRKNNTISEWSRMRKKMVRLVIITPEEMYWLHFVQWGITHMWPCLYCLFWPKMENLFWTTHDPCINRLICTRVICMVNKWVDWYWTCVRVCIHPPQKEGISSDDPQWSLLNMHLLKNGLTNRRFSIPSPCSPSGVHISTESSCTFPPSSLKFLITHHEGDLSLLSFFPSNPIVLGETERRHKMFRRVSKHAQICII